MSNTLTSVVCCLLLISMQFKSSNFLNNCDFYNMTITSRLDCRFINYLLTKSKIRCDDLQQCYIMLFWIHNTSKRGMNYRMSRWVKLSLSCQGDCALCCFPINRLHRLYCEIWNVRFILNIQNNIIIFVIYNIWENIKVILTSVIGSMKLRSNI
jgi:hypothetical protein